MNLNFWTLKKINQMKELLSYSRYKFTFLLFSLAIAVLFNSCTSDDEDPLADLNRVSMKTLPQVKYVLGNALNLSDMVITLDKGGNSVDVPFASFASEGITTEPQNGKILGFADNSVIIKVGASGKGMMQTILVTNNVVSAVIKNASKINYVRGQKLDLAGLVVTLTYENGDKKDVAYANFAGEIETLPKQGTVISTDQSTLDLVITHIVSKVNVKQVLTIEPFFPLTGALVSGPIKTSYTVGALLDLKGTVIKYTLFSGTVIEVSVDDFAAFNIASSPANGSILASGVTRVTVRHSVFGAQVNIPITVL